MVKHRADSVHCREAAVFLAFAPVCGNIAPHRPRQDSWPRLGIVKDVQAMASATVALVVFDRTTSPGVSAAIQSASDSIQPNQTTE
jgi:hypothetical protein